MQLQGGTEESEMRSFATYLRLIDNNYNEKAISLPSKTRKTIQTSTHYQSCKRNRNIGAKIEEIIAQK